MKSKLFVIFILMLSGIIFAQLKPESYKETSSNNSLSDEIKSNTIIDVFAKDDTVIVATNKGVSCSFDGGENWKNSFGTSAFGSESVSAVTFYKGIIWATTSHSVERDGSTLPEGSGLRYSTDFGNNWISVAQSVDNPADSIVVYGINNIRALPVTVAINNISYDIAVTDDAVWTTNFAGGLRKSTDKGLTWQRVVLPPDNLDYIHPDSTYTFSLQPVAGNFGKESYLNHRVFSVVAVDNDTLFVGTAGGINKSTDGGLSWRKYTHLNQANPISGNFVVSIDYNHFDKSIWAATWKAEGESEFYGISSSHDGGKNWQTYLSGFKIHDFAFMNTEPDESLVLAAADDGLYISDKTCDSWISAPEIYDPGRKFQVLKNKFYSVAVPGTNSSIVWAGTAGEGLAKFTKTGNEWTGIWQSFFVSKKIENKEDCYAFPNPFSPDEESVRIKYVIPAEGAKVTIRILDFGMNLVRTIIQNVARAGESEQIDFWDGKDDDGKIVPNGVYFFRIDSEGDAQYGKIIVLM